MSEMIERAARALFTPYTAKDGIYSFFFKSYDAVLLAKDDDDGAALHLRHLDRAARAALSAALDPHDSELQNIILGAMGFFAAGGPKDYSAMARVQAHDAIAALKSASLPPAQSVNDQRRK